AEDPHVRVAEAVDRLELVADREQVVALERLEDLQLDAVGVLELVDHQQLEALGPPLPHGAGGKQVADAQLEVLEVDGRAFGLGRLVYGAEALQQRIDELQGGAGVERGAGGTV